MKRCPPSVLVISCLFIAAGAVGLAYHATDFRAQRPFEADFLWVCFVRLVAIAGGVFMLRGHNWARWLSLAWMAYHVVLSATHSRSELIMHGLLFAVIALVLLRPQASAYFRGAKPEPTPGGGG